MTTETLDTPLDEFADIEVVPATGPFTGEDTDPKPVDVCEVCNADIPYRGRGRHRTRCDDHPRTGASAPRTPKATANTKAHRESELLAESLRKSLVKGVTLLSLVEPYDAYAIYAGHGEVISQASGVLETHDKMREFLLAMKSGGSIVGLIGAVLAIALPIAAHHELIPATVKGIPIGQALESLPGLIMQVNANVEGAATVLADRYAKSVREAQEKAQQAAQRAATAA